MYIVSSCDILLLEPQPYSDAYFGQGDPLMKVITFTCTGNEKSLLRCRYAVSNCGHEHDASVICANVSCSEGDVQLSHGSGEYEGTVEVCRGSNWVTICDSQWSSEDAKVVCRQLGYSVMGETKRLSNRYSLFYPFASFLIFAYLREGAALKSYNFRFNISGVWRRWPNMHNKIASQINKNV